MTDGRYFSRAGIQTYGFLPMRLPRGLRFDEAVHAADERIPVDALEFGAEAVWRAVQRYHEAPDPRGTKFLGRRSAEAALARGTS